MTTPELRAKIWGARGSLPNPSVFTAFYGGATTCLGVETVDDIPIVIDGGSGIFDLGIDLERRQAPKALHLFFTHTHWDHVQGLPFFEPLFDSSWTVHVYSLGERRGSLRDILSNVYAQRYFPVQFEHLDAEVIFHELGFEDEVTLGGTRIRCCRVNHPGYALGYRIDHGDRSFFFASDAAPYTDMLFGDRYHLRERETSPGVLHQMAKFQRQVEDLAQGVDLLFHDANYTDAEYETLFHFGHSSMTHALDCGRNAGASRVVLWHHDRGRTDEQVDAVTASVIEQGGAQGIIVDPAVQGRTYRLPLGSRDIIILDEPLD